MSTVQELEERLAAAKAESAKLKDAVAANGAGVEGKSRTPSKQSVFGLPNARRGENPLSSRGFRFTKFFGAMAANQGGGAGAGFGSDAWAEAKVEREVGQLFEKSLRSVGQHYLTPGTYLAPLGTSLLPDDMAGDKDFGVKVKSLVHTGTENADPDEMRWIAEKSYQAPGQKATMSWLGSGIGGDLVGPPEFREMIDLLRNQAVLIKAGAQTVPLGPTGRAIYPRQTAASTAAYVGEGATIGNTDVKTGSLVLSAKRCATIVKLSNDLLRYASPSAEALVRNDLAKTLGLTVDYYGLQGTGGEAGTPLGIINTPSIGVVAPTTTGSNGNTMAEGDYYSFPSVVRENNAEFKAYIMRPQMYFNRLKKRTDAVTGADAAGLYLWNPMRDLATGFQEALGGYPVYLSNQVSITRVKSSGVDLTYVMGGDFSEVMIAMFGALEFAVTTVGDTAFAADQTWIRATMINDIGLRHPGAIAVADQLIRG